MDFNHLILLIGTNPLPNFVVAKYFLENNELLKTITAIYTKEVFDIAKRLEKVLRKEGNQWEFRYVSISDPGSAAKIHEELTKHLDLLPEQKYHLNYTGGTKNMAVQSHYILLQKLPESERHRLSFSYLDARDFKLKFDDGSIITDDLRKKFRMKIDTLLALHDCRQKKSDKEKKESEVSFKDVDWSEANTLIRNFVHQGIIENFVYWKNSKVRPIFYDTKGNPKRPERVSLQQLREETQGNIRSTEFREHPFHKHAMELTRKAFPERQKWHFDQDGDLIIPDSRKAFNRKKGEFVQGILYLDGLWLEDYVVQVLFEEIDKEKGPFKFYFYPNLQIVKGTAEKDFEIDMIILNGYQLCGISMTTATREALCKSKAFEILHRSQQMGGEEARAVLITTLDEATALKIEEDLRVDTGGQEQLRILSARHLQVDKLWQAIKRHILGN